MPKGLSEEVIKLISKKKKEPDWLLDWRLKAYNHWLKQDEKEGEPEWAMVKYPKIDYQDIHYYAAPNKSDAPKSLDEVDPEMLEAFEKLGIENLIIHA